MSCAEYERTSAYLDGELDAGASAEAEGHIADCADCQAFVAAAAEVSEAMRAPGVRLAAPAALRARIGRS
ncbi:MAG: zf-HC2 domain-containing protein, partial [Caulobacteraceae bacterium]